MKPVQKYKCSRVILALGGNIPSQYGPPDKTVEKAIGDVAEAGLKVISTSRYYHTPCFPAGAGPDFVNVVILCEADGDPDAILAKVHAIETAHGRERRARWASRTLDIDIIAIDDLIIPDRATFLAWRNLQVEYQKSEIPDRLVVPHPRMQDRAFVLIPMADVAPEWRHPALGLSVLEMLAKLPRSELAGVRPISDR